jgi:DNA replication protein DnaC
MERLGDLLKRFHPLPGEPPPPDAEAEHTNGAPPCPVCGGAGFVSRNVPVDHPYFGQAIPCACKEAELAERRRARLERLSNLGALTRHTFDTLVADGRSPETPEHRHRFRLAVQAARSFASDPQGWLVLVGPPGSGKTHLAAAIANARIAAGEPALFVVVPDLLDHLRSTFAPASDVSYDEMFENLRTAPLLILDDLGTQSSTPWAMEKLYQLLNARYNGRLPTVVTTNRPLQDLDERLRVRVTDPDLSYVCHVHPPQSATLQRLDAALELLRGKTFATFEAGGRGEAPSQRDSLQAALDMAHRYAAEPAGWLVLQGPYGCGKTHLAAAIANARLADDEPATFVSVPDLLDHLRSTFAPDSRVTYDQLFETIRTAPLLVLDDLGTQSATAWAQEKLYQLLNYRYNARLPTVITTNLSLEQLDPRLASRMNDEGLSLVVEIDALDFRWPDAPRRALPRRPSSPRPRGSRG